HAARAGLPQMIQYQLASRVQVENVGFQVYGSLSGVDGLAQGGKKRLAILQQVDLIAVMPVQSQVFTRHTYPPCWSRTGSQTHQVKNRTAQCRMRIAQIHQYIEVVDARDRQRARGISPS